MIAYVFRESSLFCLHCQIIFMEFIVFPYYPFDVCRVLNESPVSFLITSNLCLLFFSLSVFLEACQLHWCFQRTNSLFHWFFLLFFFFHFIDFYSLLFPSVYMLWVYFTLLFLVSLGRRLDFWFETFLLI